MTYYICAWVSQPNTINLLGVSSAPIPDRDQHMVGADYRIVAEVSGEMKDASELLPLLSLEGQTLVGLDFISQTVEAI